MERYDYSNLLNAIGNIKTENEKIRNIIKHLSLYECFILCLYYPQNEPLKPLAL